MCVDEVSRAREKCASVVRTVRRSVVGTDKGSGKETSEAWTQKQQSIAFAWSVSGAWTQNKQQEPDCNSYQMLPML